MSNLAVLSFNNTNLDIVDRDGQQWLIAQQIGQALGYKDGKSINRIFSRNADEFDVSETQVVNMTPSGKADPKYDTRIFSRRGAHLIAMFARTSKAKAFRKWVLDVLDGATQQPALTTTLTPASQRTIQEQVAELAHENKAYAKYYGALKTHFRVGTYKDIPDSKLAEAIEVLQSVVVEQKALPVPEAMNIPDDMMLVSRMNFDALKNRVNLIYKRHQEMDNIKIAIELTQAALENVKRDIDKYIYRTNDAVREANLIADAMKH